MQQIQSDTKQFLFGGLLEVRVINKEDVPYFVAKDVAAALGYKNTNDAISTHCKGVAVRHPLSTAGGLQEVRIISEPDMYRLVFGSELESAVKFQDWVTEEVLPSIRKTGRYSLKDRPDTLEELRAKVEALETKYGKPAHLIKPPFLGQSYVTPLQWHDLMYVMHEISHMTINPRFALDKITTEYFKYCDSHIVTYEHALEYLAEIRAKYEEGYDPALIVN